MPEFRFHHLERRRLEQALPELLEAALAEGKRAIVQAASSEEIEALNERLWNYSDDSFLPHGAKGDGDPELQPVYLTEGSDNPNGAAVRVLLSGVDAAGLAGSAYERVLVLIDGRDPDAVAKSREQWTKVRAAGEPQSYWREGDDGGWVRAR